MHENSLLMSFCDPEGNEKQESNETPSLAKSERETSKLPVFQDRPNLFFCEMLNSFLLDDISQ